MGLLYQNGRYVYIELGKGGNVRITLGNWKEGSCPFGSLKDFRKKGIMCCVLHSSGVLCTVDWQLPMPQGNMSVPMVKQSKSLLWTA
jgi:hypothetical protein